MREIFDDYILLTDHQIRAGDAAAADKPKVQIAGEEYNVVTSEDVSEHDKSDRSV